MTAVWIYDSVVNKMWIMKKYEVYKTEVEIRCQTYLCVLRFQDILFARPARNSSRLLAT
jgi:hypothetical protein